MGEILLARRIVYVVCRVSPRANGLRRVQLALVIAASDSPGRRRDMPHNTEEEEEGITLT